MTGLPQTPPVVRDASSSAAGDPSARPESATEHLREARQILELGRELAHAQLQTGQPVDLAQWDKALAGAQERIRAAAEALELGNL